MAITHTSYSLYTNKPEHTRIDKEFTAHLNFPNDITATVSGDMAGRKIWGIIPAIPNIKVKVECEGGSVELFNYVVPTWYHYITVRPKGKKERTEKAYKFADGYGEDWWLTYRSVANSGSLFLGASRTFMLTFFCSSLGTSCKPLLIKFRERRQDTGLNHRIQLIIWFGSRRFMKRCVACV
jgi:hypothetical protein